MITTGKRYTPREIERYVDAVTPAEIQRVAQKYLWDKDIAVAALGRTDGLFDYTRLRAGKSFLSLRPNGSFRDNANVFFFSFHRHVLYDPLSVNLGLLGFFKKMRVEPIKHQCIPSWLPFCIHNLAVLHQWWFKTTIGMILFFFFW